MSTMTTEQMKEIMKDPAKMEEALKKLFDELDKDKKGYLEPIILKLFLMQRALSLGFPPIEPTKEKEEELKNVADPSGSGIVDFNGFKAAHKFIMEKAKELVLNPSKREAEVKRIFEKLDVDKKGFLSIPVIEELEKKVFQSGIPIFYKLSQEEKTKLGKLGDPNGTGQLTLEGCRAIADEVANKSIQDGLI